MFVQIVTLLLLIVTIGYCFDDPNSNTNLGNFGDNPVDPDETGTIEELVARHGFILQSHKVTTEDGYFLTVHRPVPKENYSEPDYTQKRKPVILQHGIWTTSKLFFINSPFLESGDNFGFSLVLTGRYDLWLVNSRGNGLSNGHVNLTTQDRKYWEFSIDELALYDVPAVIDFVRRQTGHNTVGFIGYSQGASILLGMLALKPEYAQLIQPAIVWAPSVYIGNMTSAIRPLAGLSPLLRLVGGKFEHTDTIVTAVIEICTLLHKPDCFFDLVMGKSDRFNVSRLPVLQRFGPGDTSNWDAAHCGQLVQQGSFTRFDYGCSEANRKHYNQSTPPEYPLENIPENFTMAIMRGNVDAFVAQSDAERLINKLRGLKLNVIDYLVPVEPWSHMDFSLGRGVGMLVYEKVYEILDEYTMD